MGLVVTTLTSRGILGLAVTSSGPGPFAGRLFVLYFTDCSVCPFELCLLGLVLAGPISGNSSMSTLSSLCEASSQSVPDDPVYLTRV